MSDITSSLNRTAQPSSPAAGFGRVLARAAAGGALGAAANAVVYGVARYAIGLPLIMPPTPVAPEPAPLILIAVLLATFVPAIGAGIVYWLLGKFTRNARQSFLIVSAVFLLLSFAGPFSLPVELSTQLTLNFMHIVAGAAIIGALTRKS